MSTYIINRAPLMYGGRQEDYLARSQNAINEAVKSFKEDGITGLFQKTLEAFAQERSNIAHDHSTPYARDYGVPRMDLERKRGCFFCYTPLIKGQVYEEYHAKAYSLIKRLLGNSTVEELSTRKKIEEPSFLGKSSSIELQVLTESELATLDHESLSPSVQGKVISLFTCLARKDPKDPLLERREVSLLEEIKKEAPSPYKRMMEGMSLECIRHMIGKSPTDWLFVTRRLEIDGKMYATSKYAVPIYKNLGSDKVKDVLSESAIAILHQDLFLKSVMFNEMEGLFIRCLQWDGKDLQELKNTLSLLLYEFTHTMPVIKGTAAIGEWLEQAIYKYHGLETSYRPEKMPNLEGLTSSLKEYVESLNSMILIP